MEKDELLKRVLMMQRLQGMESEPVSAEDPYISMEKDSGKPDGVYRQVDQSGGRSHQSEPNDQREDI